MVRIQALPWEKARARATAIRFEVFVQEQRVPVEIEIDELDPLSVHALALDDRGHAIGTGRLLPDGHIGRMAVLKPWRGRGAGGLILEALIEEARRRGHGEVVLAAQVHAMAFYRAHGFAPVGDGYQEAGIAHQDMRRAV
jgi:predicted GNAT family N-acyltransferase